MSVGTKGYPQVILTTRPSHFFAHARLTTFFLPQWYACYTYSTGYYYHTLAWVPAGEPSNPTCEAVNVTRTFLGAGVDSY